MILLYDASKKRVRCQCKTLHISFLNYLFLEPPVLVPSGNPCVPSPCGPNSQCRVIGNTPACSCLPNYIGRAPNCRPECSISEECPSNLACQSEKCVDPCPGSCGANAECTVIKHKSVCSCAVEFTGDPFSGCSPIPSKAMMSITNLFYVKTKFLLHTKLLINNFCLLRNKIIY